jgi:hypothetical protein
LIKDYELEIHYHPGKANVVADALSRKSQVNMLAAHPMPYELAKEFDRLSLGFLNNTQEVTIELEPVTPLVLLSLKLEHNIISIGIAYV